MIPEFSFTRTPHIIFGPGKFNDLDRLVGHFGKSILVVTGSNSLTEKIDAMKGLIIQ